MTEPKMVQVPIEDVRQLIELFGLMHEESVAVFGEGSPEVDTWARVDEEPLNIGVLAHHIEDCLLLATLPD